MRFLILLLPVLMLFLLACGPVHEEELPQIESDEEIRPVVFSKVDSLYLIGEFQQVRDSLLCILQKNPALQDEALFRLLGLYHGRAMEREFIDLLNTLELEVSCSLSGWKVSALDLARLPMEASAYVPPDKHLLEAWLLFETDSQTVDVVLPLPAGPGERYAMAMTATPGTLTPLQIQLLAEDADLFPSVRAVVLRELEISSETAGEWLIEVLNSIDTGTEPELLSLAKLASEDSGSFEYWISIQQNGGSACSVATREILDRYAGEYSPSWEIVDSLIKLNDNELVLAYAEKGNSWYKAGVEMSLMLNQERYDELIRFCNSIDIDEGAPDSLSARAALFRADALKESGRGGGVCYPEYLKFASEYPWHHEAREAAYNAGKYYDCEQKWNRAAEAYLISLRSSGSWGGDERAYWRGGFSLYMSGRNIEADSLWREGCSRWPFGYWRDEMLFWRARLAAEAGNSRLQDSLLCQVAQQHPWEFYGMLAAKRNGIERVNAFSIPEISLREDTACSLAIELTASGYGVAAAEMLAGGSVGSPALRAAALSLMGRHGSALHMLRVMDAEFRESSTSMLPDSLLCFYFPAPYRDLARDATSALELETSMLQGIMREESYFDRWVISRAGARGVIQLMPATAHDVGRWFDLPGLEEEEFFDPVKSVPYGALYIDRQQGIFNCETPLFLAAYNAGPANSVRWVDMHGWNPDDPELYIEQITYRETRMYVKKVLRSAWIYERFEI